MVVDVVINGHHVVTWGFYMVNCNEMNIVSRLLQSEAEVTIRWFCDDTVEANLSRLQGILLKGVEHANDFNVSVDKHDTELSNQWHMLEFIMQFFTVQSRSMVFLLLLDHQTGKGTLKNQVQMDYLVFSTVQYQMQFKSYVAPFTNMV